MPIQAVTDRQHWLVNNIILDIENTAGKMNSLERALASSQSSVIPAAAFRSRARRYIERDYVDLGKHFMRHDEDLLFCLMWLWHNTLEQPLSEFLQSRNPPTVGRLMQLAEQCATPTTLSESTEEIPMNPTTATNAPAFETRHLVYGRNVDSLTESELISAIKQVEGEIADLKAVKIKSSRITAKVKELEEMLTKIVEVLDKK